MDRKIIGTQTDKENYGGGGKKLGRGGKNSDRRKI